MQRSSVLWPTRFIHLILLFIVLPLAATAFAAGDDYRLGSGDLLKISAFGYPDLAADVRVSQSGNITFPLIGQIPVSGLSTREVETLITRRLTDGGFIRSAQVSVLVVEYQSQSVAVMGQVAKPGQYFLDRSSKVLDLLAKAGGLIIATAGDQAYLVRHDGSRQDIDLDRMFEGDPKNNPVVADGDTINVPRAPRFYIYGQVQRPGDYRLERNMTLSRAISASGGLTLRGSERRVVVKRRDAGGKERTISIKGHEQLQPDDVVFVKESLF